MAKALKPNGRSRVTACSCCLSFLKNDEGLWLCEFEGKITACSCRLNIGNDDGGPQLSESSKIMACSCCPNNCNDDEDPWLSGSEGKITACRCCLRIWIRNAACFPTSWWALHRDMQLWLACTPSTAPAQASSPRSVRLRPRISPQVTAHPMQKFFVSKD